MSRFNLFFQTPQNFCEGGWVLSAELFPTREEAAEEFSRALYPGKDPENRPVDPNRLRRDTVRFRFISREEYEWWGDGQVNGRLALWCLGETGRGAKRVWVLNR